DFIGGGLQLYKDVAGDLDFTTTYGALTFSVLKALDAKGTHFISFGLQSSYMSNRVNYNNIIALDNEPLIENGVTDKIRFWDVSAGLGWFYALSKDNVIYLGAAMSHINEPRVSFFEDGQGETGVLKYRNYIIHGGADIRINNDMSLKPNFVFKDQGPHREIFLGTFWKYKKLKSSMRQPASLYFGAWIRWYLEQDIRGTDAFIFAIRFDYKKTYVTFSFDTNVSTLRKVSAGNGGPELSVIKIFSYKKERRRSQKVVCPAFRY
ncbi:MAG TPA: type IX secretion system membrane protein PorP/SprF, partial [Phaeodactylibacter sp.]|nr:type IX secretion system membrane protein PorP/SprF [Phaeodactylibacter sp.]